MFMLKLARAKFLSLALLTLAACGGGADTEAPPVTPGFTIGGSTSGLSGTGLVLQLNGASNLAISGNGAFSFATSVTSGGAYSVTVLTQPSAPSQTCTVTNGSGTATAAVSNVAVSCTTSSFRIKGTVTGLNGSLVLRNNGGDDLTVPANGTFTFGTAVASGGAYAVTVASHPTGPAQNCSVSSGAGTVGTGDVTNVVVTCATPSFSVGGTVTGLSGSIVVRKISGSVATDITVSANGPYGFPGLASGTDYTVQVIGHPTGPVQVCSVANASGTVTADVTNVAIACSTTPFAVSGTVTGLVGTGLIVTNNGANVTVSAASPTFSFPPQADGSTYAVSVTTQPGGPWQSCAVTSGAAGTIVGAAVTNVVVTCTTDVRVVSGSIYGYTGSGLVLHNSTGADLTPTAGDSSFAFPAQPSGSAYAITVTTQPTSPTQSCAVTNDSGTVTNANVSNVVVTCTTTGFQVGGSVTGLTGSGLVLQNNGGDNLSISANGAFHFATSVNSGSPYAVTVLTQPGSPTQTCAVTGGSGTVAAAAVTTVSINCTTAQYTVGGTVTGLTGSGLVLQNNGGDNKTISGNGAFTFATAVNSGANYAVSVLVAPTLPTQSCVVTGGGNATGGGTIGGANVTNVTITCTTTALVVTARTPIDTTVGTDLLTTVTATFGDNVDASTITGASFTLTGPGGAPVAGTTSVPGNANKAVFTPNAALAFDTTYTATLTTTVRGQTAPALAANVVWTFNTGKKIAVGGYHVCARLEGADNGKIKCWGSNQHGQLGLGDDFARGNQPNEMGFDLPVVDLGTNLAVVDVSAGQHFNCARLVNTTTGADAGVKCWGRNQYNQLGQLYNTHGDIYGPQGIAPGDMGDTLPFLSPDLVAGEHVVEIATGEVHACLRTDTGRVKCWGTNFSGAPGQGTSHGPSSPTSELSYIDPVDVPLGTGLKAIGMSANGGRHTCVRLVDGSNANSLKCWGRNNAGQLGLGDRDDRGNGPNEMGDFLPKIDLGTGRHAVQVSATAYNTCALLDDQSVKCWGNNFYGQLGLGTTSSGDCSLNDCVGDSPGEMGDTLLPVSLSTTLTAARVFGGDAQNCVMFTNGKVKCWGDNTFGQLGLGDTVARGNDPAEMSDALPIVDLGTNYAAVTAASGAYHQCVVLTAGDVKCWGFNGTDTEWAGISPADVQGGQLGQGDIVNRGDGVGAMGNGLPAIDLSL